MARNDQIIRQWHLLRRLEGSAALTLQELAAGLPDELPRHLRTLRRDLAALETVGFPLTTDHVNGQTRGGCHGDDEKQVFEELCRVVEDAIDLYRRDGKPLPPPTSGRDFANKMQNVA